MYPTMYGDKGWYAFTPAQVLARRAASLVLVDEPAATANGSPTTAGSASSTARTRATPNRPWPPTSSPSAPHHRPAHRPHHADHAPRRRPDGLQPGHGHHAHQPDAGRPLPGPRRRARCIAACAISTPKNAAPASPKTSPPSSTASPTKRRPSRWSTSARVDSRTVIVQGGAYGEHRFVDVTVNGKSTPINALDLHRRTRPQQRRPPRPQHETLRQRRRR